MNDYLINCKSLQNHSSLPCFPINYFLIKSKLLWTGTGNLDLPILNERPSVLQSLFISRNGDRWQQVWLNTKFNLTNHFWLVPMVTVEKFDCICNTKFNLTIHTNNVKDSVYNLYVRYVFFNGYLFTNRNYLFKWLKTDIYNKIWL